MNTTEENIPLRDVNSLVEEVTNALRPALIEFTKTIITGKSEITKEDETYRSNESMVNLNFSELKEIPAMAEGVKKLLEHFADTAHNDNIIRKLSDELTQFKRGYRYEILLPILKDLVSWQKNVSDFYLLYKSKAEKEDIMLLFPKLLNEYKNLAIGIGDLLYAYDVEQIEAELGQDFNPRLYTKVETTATKESQKDNTISECINVGFKYVANSEDGIETKRILRLPEVSVYKFLED